MMEKKLNKTNITSVEYSRVNQIVFNLLKKILSSSDDNDIAFTTNHPLL